MELSIIPIKTINRTGDAFIDSCFHFDLVEYEEIRDWSQITDAVSLAEQGNDAVLSGDASRLQDAIRSCNELRNRYPDLDFCYGWLCTLYLKLGSCGEAHKAVADGLRLARSKFWLCEKMAAVHLKTGKLEDAVRWWIRALVIRMSTRKWKLGFETLLYLSYVAEGLGLHEECRALRQEADRLRDGIRLAPTAANNLYELTRRQGSPSMGRSITLFLTEYIYPESERQLEKLRQVAPKGIYCKHCNTRYVGEQLRWYEIGETATCVFYSCPKCRCNLAYYPAEDTGAV